MFSSGKSLLRTYLAGYLATGVRKGVASTVSCFLEPVGAGGYKAEEEEDHHTVQLGGSSYPRGGAC